MPLLLLPASAVLGAAAAATGPCDIYRAGGTPCVAAHSTVRALFGAYSGPLYQLRRGDTNATADVRVLAAGGYADAAAHEAFCGRADCVISRIYDQSERKNHLDPAPAGGNAPHPSAPPHPPGSLPRCRWLLARLRCWLPARPCRGSSLSHEECRRAQGPAGERLARDAQRRGPPRLRRLLRRRHGLQDRHDGGRGEGGRAGEPLHGHLGDALQHRVLCAAWLLLLTPPLSLRCRPYCRCCGSHGSDCSRLRATLRRLRLRQRGEQQR